MGLGFTFEGRKDSLERPSWSYCGFNGFRSRIARLDGLTVLADWYDAPGWLHEPPFPDLEDTITLKDFYEHSDCEYELTPEQCASMEPALRNLVLAIDEDDVAAQYDWQMGLRLCRYMRECAERKVSLEFC